MASVRCLVHLVKLFYLLVVSSQRACVHALQRKIKGCDGYFYRVMTLCLEDSREY